MAHPEPASAPLKALQERLQGGPPGPGEEGELFAALERDLQLEHALALLRRAGAGAAWGPFLSRLKAAVETSRVRRMTLWQIDPHRRTLRLRFEVGEPACFQHPPALVALLAQAFLEAGLPLAMGLEKTPRPVVHLAHPLPLGVPGRGEWADAGLTRAPEGPLAEVPERLNAAAGAGLRVLEVLAVPNYATPAAELCRSALWRWSCPEVLLPQARPCVEAFLQAERFELEKAGKTGGQKMVKRVEIRSLVETMEWRGEALEFRTRLAPGQALNPQKLLGAVLGLEPAAITGLERLALALAEDPRLAQADRYEPKLHNMFEDAVLLDAGPHIRIIDGDDDDPLILGGR